MAHFVFLQLLSGKFKRTQTSITDSSAPYKAKNDRVSWVIVLLSRGPSVGSVVHGCPPPSTSRPQGSTWTLIDLPGHDSLRPQYLEKFKSAAR